MNFTLIEILTLSIAVISLAVTIYLHFNNKRVKSFIYSITHSHFLLYDIEDLNIDLHIYFKKEKITNLRYVQIQLGNNGNLTIDKMDYHDDITIQFNNDAKILNFDIDIVESEPSNLSITLKEELNSLHINPLLLNPKDFFTINLLVADYSNFNGVLSRINGIKKIKSSGFKYNLKAFIPLLILGASLIFFALSLPERTEIQELTTKVETDAPWFFTPILILGVSVLVGAIISLFGNHFDRRRFKVLPNFSTAKYPNPNPPDEHWPSPF